MKAEAQVHLSRADEALRFAGEILWLGSEMCPERFPFPVPCSPCEAAGSGV